MKNKSKGRKKTERKKAITTKKKTIKIIKQVTILEVGHFSFGGEGKTGVLGENHFMAKKRNNIK